MPYVTVLTAATLHLACDTWTREGSGNVKSPVLPAGPQPALVATRAGPGRVWVQRPVGRAGSIPGEPAWGRRVVGAIPGILQPWSADSQPPPADQPREQQATVPWTRGTLNVECAHHEGQNRRSARQRWRAEHRTRVYCGFSLLPSG